MPPLAGAAVDGRRHDRRPDPVDAARRTKLEPAGHRSRRRRARLAAPGLVSDRFRIRRLRLVGSRRPLLGTAERYMERYRPLHRTEHGAALLLALCRWPRSFWRASRASSRIATSAISSVALLVAIVYALGWYTPVFAAMHAYLPGVDLYRRPADAVFLVGFLASILSGYALHRLLTDADHHPRSAGRRHCHFIPVAAFLALLALACRFRQSSKTHGRRPRRRQPSSWYRRRSSTTRFSGIGKAGLTPSRIRRLADWRSRVVERAGRSNRAATAKLRRSRSVDPQRDGGIAQGPHHQIAECDAPRQDRARRLWLPLAEREPHPWP